MNDEINRLTYMHPHFEDIFAANGIGGAPLNLELARYEQYRKDAAEENLPPMTFEQWHKVQRHTRQAAAQARLKCVG